MVPKRRQEHVPYLYSLSYLAMQCINNMNRVTKCRFTLRRILLCKWSVKMRGNCWLRCHVYMISKPLIQKYIHVWQEHVPYLYSLSYLAMQCINNMNRVTKCRFTLRRILLCKWSVKMRGNCWLRCHVYMISKPLIQKYIHVCHPDN